MSRRGQCRCGLVLTFHRTDQGYKMRCPSCGAVVRLRARKRHRRPAGAKTELMAPSPDLAPPAPDEINVELLSLSELPARSPAPPRHKHGVMAVVAVVASVALLAGAAGVAWWLLG